MIFFDTNILIYGVDRADLRKQATAHSWIHREARNGSLVLSTQVLAEFYSVATRKLSLPLDEETAEKLLDRFAAQPVVTTDGELVKAAVRRSRQDQLSLWDALIVEAALKGGCNELLSEDFQNGRRFDNLEVINPFE